VTTTLPTCHYLTYDSGLDNAGSLYDTALQARNSGDLPLTPSIRRCSRWTRDQDAPYRASKFWDIPLTTANRDSNWVLSAWLQAGRKTPLTDTTH